MNEINLPAIKSTDGYKIIRTTDDSSIDDLCNPVIAGELNGQDVLRKELKVSYHMIFNPMPLNITNTLSFRPLTPSIWESLLELFGEKGACGGCWCMTWRLVSKEYEKNKGARNRELLYQLVKNNEPLGIVAFEDGEPIGWCSISPQGKINQAGKFQVV